MKRVVSICLVVIFLAASLSGCVANTPVDTALKISYVSDPEGLESSSKEIVSSALDEISDYYGSYMKFDSKIYDVKELADAKTMAKKAVSDGADLYIGTSFAVNYELLHALGENDHGLLALIGTSFETERKDVASILFREEEPAFLAGYLAASMSKTGVVAYIGSYDSDHTEQYAAFYAGAKYKNRYISVVSAYTDSYNNSVKGKTAAEEAAGKNADIFYANCGSCVIGIEEFVRGSDMKLILSEQYTISSEEVIAQSRQYVKNAVMYVVDEFLNEQLTGGEYRFGISYGFVDLQINANVDESIKNDVAEIRNLIRTSNIKVPANMEDAEIFLGGNVMLLK